MTGRRQPPKRRAAGVVCVFCAGLVATSSWARQQAAFEATVARIRVDVIVTDGSGRFVEDLGLPDFVLLEDGERQEILGVELVDGRAETVQGSFPRSVDDPYRRAGAALPAGDTTVAARVATVTEGSLRNAGTDGAALVFLVDLPGMDWRNKARFSSAWEELLAETDALGMPRAVYMIDQVGRLHELAPLTLDASRLRTAAAAVSAEPLTRKSQRERLGDEDAGLSEPPRVESIEERARTRATLELLTQFCKALGSRGGRTSLVWVTSEVQIAEYSPRETAAAVVNEPDPGAPSGDTPSGSGVSVGPFTVDTAILRLQEELHRAANSSNVSIYTLDPTPAYELHGIGVSGQTDTAEWALALDSPLVQFSLEGLRDALKSAAAETGGKALIHWAEPAEAIRAIEADAGRFYLLTYANPDPIGDGDYHQIRVEVKDRDVDIRARSGYTDYPVDELADRTLSGALNLPGAIGGAPLEARALRKWSADGDPVTQIAVGLPEGTAVQRPGPEALEFELNGLAVRTDGGVASTLDERVRAVGAEDLPVYVRSWELPSGGYDLHLVMRDPLSGRLWATAMPVEVPVETRDWATSDLILMVPDAEGRPIPLLGDVLPEDQALAAYVEVVFGESPVMSGELFNADGTEQIAPLPPVALDRGAEGIFRGALRMTRIPPGTYALQVAVTDAAADKHRVFRVLFRALAR